MSHHEMARYIDHTLLKPEAAVAQYEQVAAECRQYHFKSMCVNSQWAGLAAQLLQGTDTAVCAVVGFPLGAMTTRAKAFEAREAIEAGAAEIDMVLNVGALRSGNYALVEEDIRAVRRAARAGTVLKVIIETCMLSQEEKVIACELARKAEADFVKTSTGFASGGATVEDVRLMRGVVGPDMGVKASGGIRTWDAAVSMIAAGANRLGIGSSIKVMTGGMAEGNY
ncbi:MAG: deoxyribose-phosphate aldolase [Spirochaeta sp. LUC14_002_19_P3]|nr:MAG: deoxyribose-phosphate aldolase [Spirochaeta sp. LUC14_002_19_P3]